MGNPWDGKKAYGIRGDGTYGPMDGSGDNAYAPVNKNSVIASYEDDLASLIDDTYANAEDQLRRKYAGAARYRNANAAVEAQKAGQTMQSPTMQALNDVYANQSNKAMGSDLVDLEGKKLMAKVSALQTRINRLIEEGRVAEAQALQKEQADAAAWGSLLTAATTVGGFLVGGVPGAIVGGAAGTGVNAVGALASDPYEDAYANYAWTSPDTVSSDPTYTGGPYVSF